MRRYAASAALVLVALSAGGCGEDDPEPIFAPTPSVSPTAVSPSADATSPSAEESVVEETAEEFIRRWIRAHAALQRDGQAEPFLELSKGCGVCATFAARVTGIYAAGGSIDGGAWTPRQIRRTGGSERRPVYDVQMTSQPTRFRESDTSDVTELPGGPFVEIFTLEARDGTWTVLDFAERAT